MSSGISNFLLCTEVGRRTGCSQSWRFVLKNLETGDRLVATDFEPGICGERLELLAVVRGLEALEGATRVTLVTRSRYVSRGLKHGLPEWRASGWEWERFGRLVPVKDQDLWKRLDRALQIHQVECQAWSLEVVHSPELRLSRLGTPASLRNRPLVRRRRANLLGEVAASLADQAAQWGDSLRTFGFPLQQLPQGAA